MKINLNKIINALEFENELPCPNLIYESGYHHQETLIYEGTKKLIKIN